jgi:hypothetical protein
MIGGGSMTLLLLAEESMVLIDYSEFMDRWGEIFP